MAWPENITNMSVQLEYLTFIAYLCKMLNSISQQLNSAVKMGISSYHFSVSQCLVHKANTSLDIVGVRISLSVQLISHNKSTQNSIIGGSNWPVSPEYMHYGHTK